MLRHLLMTTSLILVLGGSQVRGQDADELKKLKERADALEAKLKQAEKENDALRKDNEILKAKVGEKRTLYDRIPAGTVLAGDYKFTSTTKLPNGELVLTIKERDGKKFKGTHVATSKDGTLTADIEGVINGDTLTYSRVNSVELFTVEATLKGETLECKFTDANRLKADMKLKVPK
jgi:hypothetical protein